MPISDDDKFGITLVTAECGFSAELKRDSLQDMMQEIDDQLTEQGAPEDNEARIRLMMENANALSSMVAEDEIEHDEGVTDIAYSTIYAFGKRIGFDNIVRLRGITGTLIKNVLSLNPCLGDDEYQEETALLQQAMEDQDKHGKWSFDAKQPPTVH